MEEKMIDVFFAKVDCNANILCKEVLIMKKNDYGFYGKGLSGYVHYRQACNESKLSPSNPKPHSCRKEPERSPEEEAADSKSTKSAMAMIFGGWSFYLFLPLALAYAIEGMPVESFLPVIGSLLWFISFGLAKKSSRIIYFCPFIFSFIFLLLLLSYNA